MDNNIIYRLTKNIDDMHDLSITIVSAYNLLFPDIKQLLLLSPIIRQQLLSKWKYYNHLLLTINSHINQNQVNKYCTWEESFTVTLLYNIFN